MSSARKTAALLPALLALAGASGVAPEQEVAATRAALRAADAALHPIREGVLRVRSTVTRDGESPVVSVVDVYVKGPDHVLCLFREGPLAERRILTAGDRSWLVVPGSARAIPVRAGQRLLGGASIADIARLHFDDEYDGVPRPEPERVGDTWCRVLDLRARSRKSTYATAAIWIGREDHLPRKAVFHLASGRTAKEVLFTAYRRRPEGPALERLRILHRLPSERGMVTELELIDYESRALDADLFTPAGARRLS